MLWCAVLRRTCVVQLAVDSWRGGGLGVEGAKIYRREEGAKKQQQRYALILGSVRGETGERLHTYPESQMLSHDLSTCVPAERWTLLL